MEMKSTKDEQILKVLSENLTFTFFQSFVRATDWWNLSYYYTT
jgi:hypothetical protein